MPTFPPTAPSAGAGWLHNEHPRGVESSAGSTYDPRVPLQLLPKSARRHWKEHQDTIQRQTGAWITLQPRLCSLARALVPGDPSLLESPSLICAFAGNKKQVFFYIVVYHVEKLPVSDQSTGDNPKVRLFFICIYTFHCSLSACVVKGAFHFHCFCYVLMHTSTAWRPDEIVFI